VSAARQRTNPQFGSEHRHRLRPATSNLGEELAVCFHNTRAHSRNAEGIMKTILSLTAAILVSFTLSQAVPVSIGSLSGEEIMRRVNARPHGDASRMQMEMTIRDAKRGEFHKSIVMERARLASGYRTEYRITAPDHENGIGLLISEDAAQRGMWMYFPGSHQVVRVATRGFPALASDFTCEDMQVDVPLDEYDFRIVGHDRLDGFATVKVEMKPHSERLRSELGFSRSVGWVRTDLPMIVRADYYDENDTVFKTFLAQEVERIQGIWTARKVVMQNLRIQHATEVRVLDADYSVRVPEDLLTPGKLSTGPGAPPK